MPAIHNPRRQRPRVPVLGLTLLIAALGLPASAQDFVSSDRTVLGSNPMNGSYSGQSVFVGASGFVNGDFIRVANVQVDIVAPAQLNFSDVTGGRLDVYSNSVVKVTGGTFGALSSFPSVGRTTLGDTSRLLVSGGSLRQFSINGAAPAAGGASAVISGGGFEVLSGATALVQNGTLTVDGGSISQSSAPSGQPAVALDSTGTLDINGGSINSALGTNTINFFDTGLALSGPAAGSVFETNNYSGNFYTFTSGIFSDGQSAVVLRLFDAVSVGGNPLGGGFTLNPSPVPEPATALLLLIALPAMGVAVRHRCRIA